MGVLRNILKLQNIKLQLFKPKIAAILLGGIFFAFLGIIIFRNQISTFFSSIGATPIAYWKFDEGTGTTAINEISSSLDASLLPQTVPNGGPTNIDNASDFGSMTDNARRVVRTSSGTLYAFLNDGGSCEIWKSTDGTSWSEQDSANNPSCDTGAGVATAIDSTNTLHLGYALGQQVPPYAQQIFWITFSTSTDTFGSAELLGGDPDGFDLMEVVLDSSDKPHVAYGRYSYMVYKNRVSGSWSSEISVESPSGIRGRSLTINEDNIPEISYVHSIDADLTVAIGNQNNATSFTLTDVDTSVNNTNDQSGTSIAVDTSGNTWVVYVDSTTNYITLVKHNDADAWSSWQTSVTNSNVGYEPTIAIDGTDVYVMYIDENSDVVYDMYNGSTWLGETNLHTGTYKDVRAKWSYYNNNQGSTQIDYVYSDATDVYWASLSLSAGGGVSPDWKSDEFCISGKCLYFDGQNDESVLLSDNSSLDFGATSSFSVSAWVKRTGIASATQYIISKADTSTGGYKLWMDDTGDFCFGIDDDSSWGPDISSCTTAVDYDDNQWHYVVGVRDASSTDKTFLYVDGILKDSDSDTTTGTLENTNTFYIGVDRDGSSNEWLGYIDEVKVFDYAKSVAQVRADFAGRGTTKGVAAQFGNTDTAKNLSDGLIGYWKMDEVGVSGSSLTAADSSGNNRNGLGYGNVTVGSTGTGKFGNAAFFDGSGDYLDPGYSYPAGTTVTVSAWIKTTTNRWYVVGNHPTERDLWFLGTIQGSNYATFRYENNNSEIILNGATTNVKDGQWHNIVGVTTSKNGYLYVDGKLEASNTTGGNWGGGTVLIGGKVQGQVEYYTGLMDEVRIYSRALSPDEVLDLYNYAPDPVAYWKMDQTSGSAVTDSSINGNSITLGSGNSSPKWSQGKFGNALRFSTPTYGYLTDTNALSITGNLTMNAWIKSNDVTASTEFPIAGKSEGATVSYLLSQYGDEIRLYIGSANNYVTTNAANLNINQWYNVQGVYNASSQTAQVYINGNLAAVTTTGTIPSSIADSSNNFVLGYAETGGVTTVNLQVSTGDDDGDTDELAAIANSITRTTIPLGRYNGNTHMGVTRFNNVTVPQGATITSATFTLTGSDTYNCGACNMIFRIEGEDVDDSAALSTANMYNRTKTTANTAWSQQSVVLDTEYSNSVTSIVQEIIDRPGWTSGNDLSIIVEDNGSDGSEWQEFFSYNGSSVKAPQLDITYSTLATSYYNGLIDEVKIYNYARTPAQIVSDMNAGHPAPGSPVGSAIVHYKLDEGYGTTINNYGNLGSSLNGTFATGTSAPSWSTNGKFGKAINFDGSSDYISTPDNSAVDFNDQDFTISGWFYRDTATTDDMILAKRNGNAAGNQGYMVWVDDTTDKIDFEISDGTDEYDVLSSSTFTTPGWNHFVIVWDDDNAANIEIYVNGKDDNATHTGTLANIGDLSTGNELHLGNVSDNVSSLNIDYFDGMLDEIKIYNFAFTPDQIKVEYNHGQAQVMGANSTGVGGTSPSNSASRELCVPGDSSTCNAPVGEWNFENIVGSTAYDTSTNGNNGTLTNAPRQTKGKFGKGLYFDGTNDYVDFGDMTSLEGVSQATWSFWIKADAWNIGQIIMGKTNVTTTDISWLINHSSTTQGRLVITIAASASDLTRYGYVNSVLTGNEWKHITIVFDGSLTGNSNRLKLYINGVQNTLTYGSTIPATLRATSTSTVLGGISGATNYSVRGTMDQVRMYNYARTPAQIAWEYNHGAPTAYYKMDECTGTSIKDWGQNTSGGFNGNTGTLNVGSLGVTSAGTCTTSGAWYNGVSGKREASVSFDGSDDYVTIADNTLLDITSAMSVSAWVKMDTLREQAFVSKWNGPSNYASWAFATDWTNNDEFYLAMDEDGNPVGTYFVTSTNADLEAGTWYHLTAVWNGTNVTLYKNGLQLSTTTSGTVPSAIYSGAATLNIGAANAGSTALFDGQLDDVKIFNYALTPQQIKTEMAGGSVRFQ